MKYLIVIATVSAFLAKDIYQFSWDIWFRINQEAIAEQHCENKDKPVLQCDGKCYLTKQLQKAEISIEKEVEQPDAPVRPKVNSDAQTNHFAQLDWLPEASLFLGIHDTERQVFPPVFWNDITSSSIEHPPCV